MEVDFENSGVQTEATICVGRFPELSQPVIRVSAGKGRGLDCSSGSLIILYKYFKAWKRLWEMHLDISLGKASSSPIKQKKITHGSLPYPR